jgi:hypothetical protein
MKNKMKNNKFVKFALLSTFVTTSAFATSVTFNVDTSFVFDGATEITKANASGYTALGVFGDLSSADFSSAASFAADLASFTTEALNPVPSGAPIPNVWSESVDSLAAGNTANLIIYNGADLANATSWGVVTSSYLTGALGSEAIGFNTTNKWDSAYAGTLTGSSFALSTVPEPSTFAALAGLCALSFVMVRRRRA